MNNRPYAPDDYSGAELARELAEIVPAVFNENEWAARVIREAAQRLATRPPAIVGG